MLLTFLTLQLVIELKSVGTKDSHASTASPESVWQSWAILYGELSDIGGAEKCRVNGVCWFTDVFSVLM